MKGWPPGKTNNQENNIINITINNFYNMSYIKLLFSKYIKRKKFYDQELRSFCLISKLALCEQGNILINILQETNRY